MTRIMWKRKGRRNKEMSPGVWFRLDGKDLFLAEEEEIRELDIEVNPEILGLAMRDCGRITNFGGPLHIMNFRRALLFFLNPRNCRLESKAFKETRFKALSTLIRIETRKSLNFVLPFGETPSDRCSSVGSRSRVQDIE